MDESETRLADFHRLKGNAMHQLSAALTYDEKGDHENAVKAYEVAIKHCKIALAAFDAGLAQAPAPAAAEWEALKSGPRAALKAHYDACSDRLRYLWDTQKLRALEAKSATATHGSPKAAARAPSSRAVR